MTAVDPDEYKTFQQIVESNGFIFEEHLVTTADNYTLKMFRIPGKNETLEDEFYYNGVTGKNVVFFQHGLLDSADCWVMNTAEHAPAFVAARAGFDVWLGNNRGNKYSHDQSPAMEEMNITKQEFWDFSFVEMGDFDLKAQVTYVLSIT